MDPRKQLQNQVLVLLATELLGAECDLFRLHKLEFLDRNELEKTQSPVPFDGWFLRETYGPISPQVYDALRELRAVRLIAEGGYRNRGRQPTELGREVLGALSSNIEGATMDRMRRFAQQLSGQTFDEIREACYRLTISYGASRTYVGDIEPGDEVYGYPERWIQVVSDEALLAYKAEVEAILAGPVRKGAHGLEIVERLLG